MDDLKFLAKSKNQIDSLVGIKRCGVLIMERGKVIRADGIRLPNGQHMKYIDETGYTYFGILKTHKIKEKEMKEKIYQRSLGLVIKGLTLA